MIYHTVNNPKTGMAVTFDKDFTTDITRDKEQNFTMVKESVLQEDIKILIVYSHRELFRKHEHRTEGRNTQIYTQIWRFQNTLSVID